MCGIALLLSGARILGCDLCRERRDEDASTPAAREVNGSVVSLDGLKAALQRRGPDSMASRKILLKTECINSVQNEGEDVDGEEHHQIQDNASACIISSTENAGVKDASCRTGMASDAEIELIGATLHLRGLSHMPQPLQDVSRNLLVYNGEIFGGIHVAADDNDGRALLSALERCCPCGCHGLVSSEKCCCCNMNSQISVPDILSTLRGPWALIYWQEKSKTIWFGRDAFGRRSLLVHWPTIDDSRFLLSSVSAPSLVSSPGPEVARAVHRNIFWEELPCGIYSICFKPSKGTELHIMENIIGEITKHAWTDPLLNKLVKWERNFIEPRAEVLSSHGFALQKMEFQLQSSDSLTHSCGQSGYMLPAQKVLNVLRESVMRRTALNCKFGVPPDQKLETLVPVAVLFSGGLDSMILAALLDQCLNSTWIIDLLNVSFDGELAPDRVSARMGLKELQEIAPSRRWRLVEIDATLSSLTWETKHLQSLIHPSKTYMDLNIGIALWLAAGGEGWVDGNACDNLQHGHCRYRYKSSARVLFVGSGADEQCAGYGRHKTKYRQGGWPALQEEMRLDMQRIWKRNLSRDDRCISDHGKEARFPFLDEDVIETLLETPLWEIAELDEPAGRGDKKILREVAWLLGIEAAATLPKRAIQFGSRIARESNRRTFGSNRAANQASAGSIEFSDT